jgi:hypothetical protein
MTLAVTPTEVDPSATDATLTEEAAAVTSNSAEDVDTIMRPSFDGIMTFQAIRDETAPETYSWTVHLEEGQTP